MHMLQHLLFLFGAKINQDIAHQNQIEMAFRRGQQQVVSRHRDPSTQFGGQLALAIRKPTKVTRLLVWRQAVVQLLIAVHPCLRFFQGLLANVGGPDAHRP